MGHRNEWAAVTCAPLRCMMRGARQRRRKRRAHSFTILFVLSRLHVAAKRAYHPKGGYVREGKSTPTWMCNCKRHDLSNPTL